MISSFLKVTSFYKDFLNQYYRLNPSISGKSFNEQYKHLMDQGYGYADYFPRYLKKNHDIKADEVIHNAWHMQRAWANENGISLSGDNLLMEQIKAHQPEVLFIQDSANFSSGYIDRIREQAGSLRLLIGHCCAPYTESNLAAFSRYDLILTCSQKFLEELESKNIRCRLFPHAVEATLVAGMPGDSVPQNDIIFIGSLFCRDEFHRKRIQYLEEILSRGLPLRMSGIIEEDPWHRLKIKQASYLLVKSAEKLGLKGFQSIRRFRKIAQLKEMPVRTRYSELIRENLNRELLFGREMLMEISRHAIGFNMHGEVAGDYASNVRIFEVAGTGALLFTDHKKNIRDLYEPDHEILTYESVNECTEKLKWAIDHPSEVRKIAAAGRTRTLKDHTVEKRVDLLMEIIREELTRISASS